MNEITISREQYESLLVAKYTADALMNLFANKAQDNKSIYADEVTTICNLFGIEVGE